MVTDARRLCSKLYYLVASVSLLWAVTQVYLLNKLMQTPQNQKDENPIGVSSIMHQSGPNSGLEPVRKRRFSDPSTLPLLTSLGPNFVTTTTGCRRARWVYQDNSLEQRWKDCAKDLKQQAFSIKVIPEDLKAYDTIYVPFKNLEKFVDQALDKIRVSVVIISGGQQIFSPPAETVERLLHSSYVQKWFCQNPVDPHHPKISPFPYGLQDLPHKHEESAKKLEMYKHFFLNYTTANINKSSGLSIYAGYIKTGPKRPNRDLVPHLEKKVPVEKYFADVAAHTYILAPNGDRPECYRHLEALGLGTVPITELDPFQYRHLNEGPIIYNTSTWDLNTLQLTLDPHPVVNRNMVLEEYWMEYVDFLVGHPLRWWDWYHFEPSLLEDILRRSDKD